VKQPALCFDAAADYLRERKFNLTIKRFSGISNYPVRHPGEDCPGENQGSAQEKWAEFLKIRVIIRLPEIRLSTT
jgi:hypothetical protein